MAKYKTGGMKNPNQVSKDTKVSPSMKKGGAMKKIGKKK